MDKDIEWVVNGYENEARGWRESNPIHRHSFPKRSKERALGTCRIAIRMRSCESRAHVIPTGYPNT